MKDTVTQVSDGKKKLIFILTGAQILANFNS
jgi:hypothetical protein